MLFLPSLRAHRLPDDSALTASAQASLPESKPFAEPSAAASQSSPFRPATLVSAIWANLTNTSTDPVDEAAQQELEARIAVLTLSLRDASTLEEWRGAALELDKVEGNDSWKEIKESDEYDYELIQSRLEQLDDARISCDPRRMLLLIRTAFSRHLGGMGSVELYRHSHVGTKRLIERYIDSALETIASVLEYSRKPEYGLEPRFVMEQLLAARQAFGRSALLFSGGGTFGMNHIGVAKCLWEAKLLPRIISGSSAGSIVCSVLCSRTDDELPAMMAEFCYGELDVFVKDGEDDGMLRRLTRLLKCGAIYDVGNLIRVMRNLLGDITFQEAYNRTRRILNICVSSAGLFELPRLLNYLTAPNVIIWSAVQVSCSVPGVFTPVPLMAKDPRSGEAVPWNPSSQSFIDGSVDGDLPMTRLAEMFNVNHFIVSQVNPHVVPFLGGDHSTLASEALQSDVAVSVGALGPAWLQKLASNAREEALHRMQVVSELGIFPTLFTKLRSVLNQRYSGDITIFPEIPYTWFPRVLENPTTSFMLQANYFGQRATWPQLSRIQNHCAIELALDDAVQQLRARIAFSPSQVDLRLGVMRTPLAQHLDPATAKTSRRIRHNRTQTTIGHNLTRSESMHVANEARTLSQDFRQGRKHSLGDMSKHLRNAASASHSRNREAVHSSAFNEPSGYDESEDDDQDYFTMPIATRRVPSKKQEPLLWLPITPTGESSKLYKTSAGSTPYPRSPAISSEHEFQFNRWSQNFKGHGRPLTPGPSSYRSSAASLNGTGLLQRSSSFHIGRQRSRSNLVPLAPSQLLENEAGAPNDLFLRRRRSLNNPIPLI